MTFIVFIIVVLYILIWAYEKGCEEKEREKNELLRAVWEADRAIRTRQVQHPVIVSPRRNKTSVKNPKQAKHGEHQGCNQHSRTAINRSGQNDNGVTHVKCEKSSPQASDTTNRPSNEKRTIEICCEHCGEKTLVWYCDSCAWWFSEECHDCHDELTHAVLSCQNANIGGGHSLLPGGDSPDRDPDAYSPSWKQK